MVKKKQKDRILQCPSCGGQVTWSSNPHRPFCSEFCQRRDLGNWATERYCIAGEDEEENKKPGEE
ncbi:MAG: DNA gyrase inhibitor YacG [Deltaproteobacteria bacterium]|nr:DNA gyrase inhibitor YacG [Deltaproteobacteria bacterium]